MISRIIWDCFESNDSPILLFYPKILVSFAKTSTEFRDEEFEEKDADAVANGPNVTGEILTQVRH